MATPFIHLILQYFNDPLPERQAEYDFCVEQNLAHPLVAALHNLVEPGTRVPERFAQHEKYRDVRTSDRRLTFANAFDYANAHLSNQIVGLLNLDTFLDPACSEWATLDNLCRRSAVICLSRTEFDPKGRHYQDPALAGYAFANSQDAWFFVAPITVPDCEIAIGTLGCDNAIAERLHRTDRFLLNAPSRFRLLHVDRARKKTHDTQKQFHAANTRPEESGQYLLPDIDQMRSVDQLLAELQTNEFDRYKVICDVLNRFRRISNR